MIITPSKFRSNIYRLLDQVIETGEPLLIKRHKEMLKVSPIHKSSKLDRLIRHSCLKGDPESIVHCDWSKEWSGDIS